MSINCTSETQERAKALSPPKGGDVYVVAHRGAHIGIPENTLASYEAAIAMGVDFVEVDLRTTRDGHIVSIHNKDIDSYVANGELGLVSEMTLEQLKQLDIGSRISPEWSNERIPTFEEILGLCKGRVGIYLDLKDASVDKLVYVVKLFRPLFTTMGQQHQSSCGPFYCQFGACKKKDSPVLRPRSRCDPSPGGHFPFQIVGIG